MKRGEDEGKKVLFCEQYNMVSYPPTFVSQPSSSNVSTAHHNALASMAESYYSYSSSLRKTDPMIFEPPNDRKPMVIPKYEHIELKPERVARKRCSSESDFSSRFYPGDCTKPAKIEPANECGNGNSQERPSGVVKEEEEVRSVMPDDVVRVLGQKLFEKARKTILEQQRIFSFQILELHRLIKVQKLIARSPDKHFTPMFPLDRPPPVPRPKNDSLSLKLAPWFFHPPIGNQWLQQVPIKPCFPIDRDENSPEREGLGLALFPTTPSSHLSRKVDDEDEGKARVIKVVPHNRKSASESAARIFRSLQEERRIRRVSSCGSHVS